MLAATPSIVSGQSTLERSANLNGGWVGERGVGYFHFLHRFSVSSAPQRKITSSPTFLVAYSPISRILAGVNYATQSLVAESYPNEWELFARWSPLPNAEAAPLDASVQVAYNNAAQSVDGSVDAGRTVGRVRLLGTARAFSSAYGGDAAVALGGGLVVRLGPFALSGDAGRVINEGDAFWGAGLQWRIPASPHTLSLHASNANTATLQGSSRGSGRTLYGFEFTIPLTISRYLSGNDGSLAHTQPGAITTPIPGPAFETEPQPADAPAPRDTVVITIKNLAFSNTDLEVGPGTLVRWVNEDPLDHTVTSSTRIWDSGAIKPAAKYERMFNKVGDFEYSCTPHPFMKGKIRVKKPEPGIPQ